MGRAEQGMIVVERAKRLILNPRAEWEVVAAEPMTIGQIYASYALPLARIPAVAGFVGASLVGMGVPVSATSASRWGSAWCPPWSSSGSVSRSSMSWR